MFSRSLCKPLEEYLSKHLSRKWRASSLRDLSERACHPCAILSDGAFSVFVKFGAEIDAETNFQVERDGLVYLSEKTGVLVPKPIGILPVDQGTFFLMEALEEIERGPREWRQIGKTLARIHRVKADTCGFHQDNFFGPLVQANTQVKVWSTFYRDSRLLPHLKLAVDSGNLPAELAEQVEAVIERLPELCGPEVTPTLLHGDAQQNNYVSTPKGTFVIDPAIHFGHPELDLAYMDYFQPVPREVFDAYQEEMPIDPGFPERRGLWRISGYLAAVAVEGGGYMRMLADALRSYV